MTNEKHVQILKAQCKWNLSHLVLKQAETLGQRWHPVLSAEATVKIAKFMSLKRQHAPRVMMISAEMKRNKRLGRENDLIHSLEASWSRKCFRMEQKWGHVKVCSSTVCIFNKTILYFTAFLLSGLCLPEALLALCLPIAMPDTSMCDHSLISTHSCKMSRSETLQSWPWLLHGQFTQS